MIRVFVKRNEREADVRFPCEEKDIRRVQSQLEIPYETDTRVKIISIDSDIEELSILEGQDTDLDYLNLLGRVMYGMDEHEYKQFRLGLYYEKPTELKDIINISQAVNRYSIITEDLGESGLDHEMDIRGGIPTSEVDVTDYSAVAKKLLDSGNCKETPYGTLYVNEDVPVDQFFDGKHLPPYFDRKFQIACFLENNTDRDFLMLPCTDEELLRSAKRLDSSFPYDLKVWIEDYSDHNNPLFERLIKEADIYTLNRYAKVVESFDEDENEKFRAVISYVDRSLIDDGGLDSLYSAAKIGESLEAFSFYPNVLCDEELGLTLLEENDVPEELWGYFDAERYGNDFCDEQTGEYTDDGYVGVSDYHKFRNCLSQNQGMGGMV